MGVAALAVSPGLVGADSSSLTPHEPIVINGDADFTSANGVTAGTGTASDPYIIQGWNITSCCNSPGISIQDTGAYFVIRNVYVNSGWLVDGVNITNVANGALENSHFNSIRVTNSTGVEISNIDETIIRVDLSRGVQIFDNTGRVTGYVGVSSSTNVSITNNLHYRIGLANSSSVIVSGNNLAAGCCTTDFTGLRIENSTHITVSANSFYSDYAIVGENSGFLQISDNQISNAGYGAILLNSCSDISIQRNVIGTSGGAYRPPNPAVGVTKAARINISENNITQSFDPTRASLSQNVSIVGNNISNSTTAIGISHASGITISGNSIQSNMQGVLLNDTMNVQVFHNNFLNNTVQAIDTFSTRNVWDNGYPSGGNYWSDYTGTDPDMDGIGDTPYVFNYNQDNYPLMAPYYSVSQSTQPSSTSYAIRWQGYDWDGGGEETVALNGQFLATLPTVYSPQNGGTWVAFSLSTMLLVQGTNTLSFTHANFDCPYIDQVSNLVVSNQTSTVYSNATVESINTTASCTDTLTYTFTV